MNQDDMDSARRPTANVARAPLQLAREPMDAVYPRDSEERMVTVRTETGHSSGLPGYEGPLPESGDLIGGQYLLGSTLGVGDSGIVFEARDTLTGETVALKTARAFSRTYKDARRRLRHEVTVLSQIDSDRVPTILQAKSEPHPWFAMTCARGESLRSLLQAGRTPTIPGALRVVVDVLDALRAVHQTGHVHRDVRPENIVYDAEHQRATLIDFGLCLRTEGVVDRWARRILPGRDSVGAAPAPYRPPEELLGQAIGPQGDIYQTGLVFWELLTRSPTYSAENLQATMRLHMDARHPPLLPSSVSLHRMLQPLISRSLAPKPRERFRTAEAFKVAALEAELSARAALDARPMSGL